MKRKQAPESKEGDSLHIINTLLRERARLRIAYMTLYKQFMDLDDTCRAYGIQPTTTEMDE